VNVPASDSKGRLAGKVALITGTGGGQGREAARIFAREGALVVGCDINAEGALETAALVENDGNEMLSIQPVDLSVRAEVEAWVEQAVEAHGRVDILYNNASLPRFAPFAEMSDEDFRFTIQNELDVCWIPTQVAWPHLAASGSGVVINVASVAGIVGLRTLPEAAHSASKGAVIGLTRQLAAEGAAVGIRVNCISPGVINSPPVQELLALGEESPLNSLVDATASGKPGEPEDVVYAALYFGSDEAKWVTGAHLVVDGGASTII